MLSKLLANPYVTLMLTLVMGGVGLMMGRYAVVGGRICLGLAWLIGTTGLFAHVPRGVAIGSSFALASVLWFVGLYIKEPPQPENTGVIAPVRRLLFSPKGGAVPMIQIGRSGTSFVYAGQPGLPFIRFAENSDLIVESVDGQIMVSMKLFDRAGNLVAVLQRNEWKVAPPPNTWDRNYNKDTLEVLNSSGRVVLQVHTLPDRIQLQGEWWSSGGRGLRLVENPAPEGGAFMMILTSTSDPEEPRIRPLFRYPSERHFGELAR